MSLRIAETRQMVDKLCAAIDAGDVTPDEGEMLALATYVESTVPWPQRHDLLVKLASRCANGRAEMKRMAQ
jgi:hypothetical protein